MQRQGSFSQAEYAGKKKQTRRDKFLAEMEQAVPWSRLVARLRPLYPKGERGRPPIGLERMLRIYFVQQWYGLADEAVEDAFYDSQALRGFAGIDLNRDPEMHQTKKGNQWHFGMKAHIGVDVASGVVHTLTGTAANEADITQMAAVLHGEEEAVFAIPPPSG